MSDSSPARLHLWSGLIILAVFLSGAATAAGVFAWLRPPHLGFHGRVHAGPMMPLRGLDLTPEQEQRAHAIIEAHFAEVEATMRDAFPKIRALRDSAAGELRAILTPEQARQFDENLAEMDRHGPFGGRGLGLPMPPDGRRPPPPPEPR